MSTVAIVGAPRIGPSGTRFFYLLFSGLGAAGAHRPRRCSWARSSTVIIRDRRAATRDGLARRADRGRCCSSAGGAIASTRDVFFVLGFVGFIGVRALDARRQRA